jgi:hypothetical protein
MDLQKRPSEHLYALLTWVLLLFAYHVIFGAFFPTPQGTIGDDYGLGLASLVDGFIWFSKNGPWAVPWFSPGFCGGQPFFADPQSGYYSVPQWLTFLTDPLTACYLTLLLFASAGYFGIYFLARRSFGLPIAWAILAAALYFFNGFMPHRMIVGHGGYHGLSLAPWLALALLTPAANRIATIGLGILAGAIVAYWLQSGLTTLMVPAALSVALVLLVYRLSQPWPQDLLSKLIVTFIISVALSASKLVASLSFYSQFERTQYLLPGFDNPFALLAANLFALFGPSAGAAYIGYEQLVNAQWTLFKHEWAFGFTIVPILLLTRARALARSRAGDRVNDDHPGSHWRVCQVGSSMKIAVWLAIALILLIPLAMQFYTPELNAWYKRVPLIGATVAPMRWLIIYLPVLPIVTALIARHTLNGHQDGAPRLITGIIVVLIGLTLAEFWQYFGDQTYSPDKVLAGYERLAAGEFRNHRVHAIGKMTDPITGEEVTDGRRNDIVVDGISQAHCYNPSFGYRLDKLPTGNLIFGDVLSERNGFLNIRNPACYVFPKENGCQPGDRFRSDQYADAEAFVSYRPFPFRKSTTQLIADWGTLGTVVFIGGFLSFFWPWHSWHRRHENCTHLAPRHRSYPLQREDTGRGD